MKNLTEDQKSEIISHVKNLLDKPNVEIFVTLSAETAEKVVPSSDTLVYELTGAMAVCVSVVSSPALMWKNDVEALKENG